jgi:hypothetical protein
VVVTAPGVFAPAAPAPAELAPAAVPAAMSPDPLRTPFVIKDYERPPDLTVTIVENDDSTLLEWHFETSHAGLGVPSHAVRTRFAQQNAQDFAMQQIRLIHESIGDAAVGTRVLGISRTIAEEVPPEAWRVLSDVWRLTAAEHRLPSVMLISTDAYVPWELASTEAEYITDQTLIDTTIPPILGAQVSISRWNSPRPRGASGIPNPPTPPPEALAVDKMVLVIGDYLALSGQRALPKANEEGNELAALYKAMRLTATLDEIDPMIDGVLERDGVRVDPNLVHFACHGQIDPNPGFNGIVLNEGNIRLDAEYVRGNKMKKPFIFINACQVGQNTALLNETGGLATSFLNTGASGFIAPLWNVDDQIAKDTAIDFYQAALDERVTVGEVLRRRRAQFDYNATTPQPTHLAYVYYGNPNLLLARAG